MTTGAVLGIFGAPQRTAASEPLVCVTPPSFAAVPPLLPGRALFCSGLLHAGILASLSVLSILSPPGAITLRTPADLIREAIYQPLTYRGLPGIAGSGSGAGAEGGSAGSGGGRAAALAARAAGPRAAGQRAPGSRARPLLPKAVYAGAQEIVSNLPSATNTVQTIRRPDLIAPPKLRYPIRLQSLVLLPAPAVPVLVAPSPPRPPPPQAVPVIASGPAVQNPALPIRTPPPLSGRVLEPPKVALLSAPALPVLSLTPRALPVLSPEGRDPGPKAAVVINAVAVPPNPLAAIPDAEIAGSFAVTASNQTAPTNNAGPGGKPGGESGTEVEGTSPGPGTGAVPGGAAGTLPGGGAGGLNGSGKGAGGIGSGHGTGQGSGAGLDAGSGSGAGHGRGSGNGAGVGTGHGAGSGPGSGTGTGTGSGTGTGTGSGTGTGTGSGTGAGPGTGSGYGGLPGISISGGSSGRSSGGRAVLPGIPRGSYAITIVSGGSSGGASRDLGVFARYETVYTVYIQMADAGGGPDWPMQYALAGSAPAGNGLLTPPFAVKKVRAAGGNGERAAGSGQVFITGIIDEKGKLRSLQPLRPQDPRSPIAVSALEQWEFLPAQIEGRAVETKVLIGVTVMPAGEPQKQN